MGTDAAERAALTSDRTRSDLVLIVPFHNEERYLPTLIDSLRRQEGRNVPVVFVDNGSTDGSAVLLQECDEIRAGSWFCVSEERIGKFYAMQTGITFSAARLAARFVGFLDADSYCADGQWVSTATAIIERSCGTFGYTISPFRYVDIDHLPTFETAYRAYESVLWRVMEVLGWLANGQAFVCPVDVLTRYFQRAEVTTEIDLRLSLLALSQGLGAENNPSVIMTSARRIVVNAKNFGAWCFYEREFYSRKDINAAEKLDLNAPEPVADLQPDMIGQFFYRRSLKLACRHLIPFVLFSRTDPTLDRMEAAFGTNVRARVSELLGRFMCDDRDLFTDRFEGMIITIERHPASALVAQCLTDLMRAEYEQGRLRLGINRGEQ